ncbi:MAG: hypothetical protein M3328_16240, partial [Chloroflexota bacterium]|nr:hypothetical protein [Chloroflexota bacterium]
VSTTLWLNELAALKDTLVDLQGRIGKDAEAEFSIIESALQLEFSLLRTGGLTLNVEIREGSSLENLLAFVIEADQSYLPLWIEQITHVLAHLEQ